MLQAALAERVIPDPPPKSVEALISRVAEEYGISSSTLHNLAQSESRLNPGAIGDGGKSCGVVQIQYKLWGFTCEELIEHPEIGLQFAAKHIRDGTAWKYWTPMNCYSYLKYALNLPLPKMAHIIPNSDPRVGSVAIFRYADGTKHVAYVQKMHGQTFTVREANFKAGLVATREVSFTDPYLQGFYVL
jgi:hypothetical protein